MENKTRQTVSIGEAARQCGCSAKQIRHWSAKGHIPEPLRVICGERAYRQFGTDDLEQIKRIKFYLDEGFRLDIAAEKAKADIAGGKTKDEDDFHHERNTEEIPA